MIPVDPTNPNLQLPASANAASKAAPISDLCFLSSIPSQMLDMLLFSLVISLILPMKLQLVVPFDSFFPTVMLQKLFIADIDTPTICNSGKAPEGSIAATNN